MEYDKSDSMYRKGARVGYLLGIDAGTSSFKAALFDHEGRLIAKYNEGYSLVTPAPSIVEFPADGYWELCRNVIRGLLQSTGPKPVDAVAISSQGETLICLDRGGNPLRNAIVWLDNRSDAEADELRERFTLREVYERTGQSDVAATWPSTKILWLGKHEPEVFGKTSKFLLLEDYLIYKLTGEYAAEKSLLCSSLLLDIRQGRWWSEMLDYLGVTPGQLPRVEDSGVAVGRLTGEAAEETGLDKGTPVVTGALDQTAGLIGAGALKPGSVLETTGSCLAVCAGIDRMPPYDPARIVTCQCHAVPGAYYLLFWAQTAGIVLKWFKENFFMLEEERAAAEGRDVFEEIEREALLAPAGSDGMIMLPHLSGAAGPEYNPHAKGVFYGITLRHGRPHFTRAIMESIAYIINRYVRILEELGVRVDEIRSIGGGAKTKLWNAIKADVTGKNLVTVDCEEASCLGAALLAGAGCGVFHSVRDARPAETAVRERYEPDLRHGEIYRKRYDEYLKLYESLEDMFGN
jgi:xylulokinase